MTRSIGGDGQSMWTRNESALPLEGDASELEIRRSWSCSRVGGAVTVEAGLA
jgi:hypothetical protein